VDPEELFVPALSVEVVDEPSTSPAELIFACGFVLVSRGIKLYKVPTVPKKPIASAAAP
jgi:hypothetical protein